jgi:hypothetical protein
MKRLLLWSALFYGALSCGQEPSAPDVAEIGTPAAGLDLTSRNLDPPTAVRNTYDEMAADLAAERHPSDGGGHARILDGPLVIGARERSRWTLEFETGPLGIAVGGRIFLIVSPFWGWSSPQSRSEAMPGFTTVEPAAPPAVGDTLQLEVDTFGAGIFTVEIGGRALAPGERLVFVYGAGSALAIADKYAEREAHLWFAVDGDGDGVRGLVEDSPTVQVLPGPPAQLHLFAPGTARPGDTVRFTAAVLDAAGSAGVDFEGELLIASDERWPGLPERIPLTSEMHGLAHFELTLAAGAPEGVLRLGAACLSSTGEEARALVALSNPLLISSSTPRVLWADLHGHSGLSDGTGTPEDYFHYAREVAALDVGALTDHDHWGMRFLDQRPDLWERITKGAAAADEPGVFTSLVAFEWTNWIHGHRHVLYFEDTGPMISSMDPATDDPGELWERLRGENALTFAHHSAGAPVPVNWSFAPDPELEPVTEISSVHGTSEAWDAPLRIRGAWRGNFVRDVLDAGATLGFIGSGDSHDGHPGLAQLAAGTGGLAALFAEENTRAAVKASLKARACYATNGPRMLLFADLAGQPMGTELVAADLAPDAVLDVRLFGTAPLTRLEVIRSGKIVKALDAAAMEQDPEAPPDFAATFPLAALGLAGLEAGEYVYLRAVEQGPGIAWSSAWFIR